jgi:RNA polymerase sigma-70 factor (ECF subfamily)
MDRRDEFMSLFLKHRLGLSAFVLASLADRHAAEDLLQDIALTLWQSFDQYDAARPFGPWARGVAAHKILNHAVKARPAVLSAEAIEAVAAAFDRAEADHSRETEALRYCLEKLPEKSRGLLTQRYQNSRKLAEMASELHSTVDAINKALSRVRAGLQKCV